jgi:hypothetical protein
VKYIIDVIQKFFWSGNAKLIGGYINTLMQEVLSVEKMFKADTKTAGESRQDILDTTMRSHKGKSRSPTHKSIPSLNSFKQISGDPNQYFITPIRLTSTGKSCDILPR